jgi:hypothetical protein
MNHIGMDPVQKVRKSRVNLSVPVSVPGAGHVDESHLDLLLQRVLFAANGIIRGEGILFARENPDRVPPASQLVAKGLGINLGAGVESRRIAVGYFYDPKPMLFRLGVVDRY